MKRTALKRGSKGLQRKTRMKARSARRTDEASHRSIVRLEVIDRDRGCVAEGIPGVPHGQIGGRAPLEVNELQRGVARSSTYLDPAWCIALCPMAHDWVTDHPDEAKRRGLQVPPWQNEPDWPNEAALTRAAWCAGEQPTPSWIQEVSDAE